MGKISKKMRKTATGEKRRPHVSLDTIIKSFSFAAENGITSKSTLASSLGLLPKELEEKLKRIEKQYGVKFPEEFTQDNKYFLIENPTPVSNSEFLKLREIIVTAVESGMTFKKMAKIFKYSEYTCQFLAESFVEKVPQKCYRSGRKKTETTKEIKQINLMHEALEIFEKESASEESIANMNLALEIFYNAGK